MTGDYPYQAHWRFSATVMILVTGLMLLVILAFTHYSYFILPGIGLAAVFLAVTFRNPTILAVSLFAATALNFYNVEGFYIWGTIFYAFSFAALLCWVLPWAFMGKIQLHTKIDVLYVIFLAIIFFGVANGILHSGSINLPLAEIAYFSPIFGYFIFKEYFHAERIRKIFFWVMIGMMFYVLIRNFLNYRELILAAVMEWETQKARSHRNEVILLWGSVLFLVLSIYQKSLAKSIVLLIPLLLFLAGLVLTQSRGYWVAFALSALVFFIIANSSAKAKMLVYGGIVAFLGISLALLFFGDLFTTVSGALIDRVASIGSGQLDSSLRERVLETKTVFEKTLRNPITGYGLGTQYDKMFLTPEFRLKTIATSYVHNGYLAIWYKFGLIGLVTILLFCFFILKYSYYTAKRTTNPNVRIILLAMFSTLCGMLLVNLTSPQFITFECNFLLFMMAAYTSFHYAKLKKSEGDDVYS